MEQFTVQDGRRQVQFEGRRLASASSEASGKRRWVEFTLYRTAGGMYVLHGIGRSVVSGEVDRHWVRQAEEPAGVMESLYMMGDEGQKYLPRTAQDLLEDAATVDPAVHKAYFVERIA